MNNHVFFKILMKYPIVAIYERSEAHYKKLRENEAYMKDALK